MAHHFKTRRELERLAKEFDLELLGYTARGHLRWLHRPTGKTVVTISNTKHHRALDNTRRTIKRMLGTPDGHHTSAAD
jgi:hypothetical protein